MKTHLRTFINYLLLGVVAFLPIALVLQIVVYIQRLLKDFVLMVHGRYDNPMVTVILFASALAILAYFGRLLKHDKAHVLYYLESFIQRIPVIGTIYRVTRKLVGLFFSNDESQLREVVLVEYPKDGMWVPAYVTNKVDDWYVLYVPTSPNPTSGFTVMVHQSKVRPSTMSIEEASSFVISVGVDFAAPKDIETLRS